jgi:hydrogenase nickel incorporation protein HypA/HybF
MHEMSLAEGILQLVAEAAAREAAVRVHRVRVDIGQLACVEAEALAFCFSSVAAATPFAGVQLDLVVVPGQGRCQDCAASVPMQTRFDACPACGGYRLAVTAGGDMRVRDIEIE